MLLGTLQKAAAALQRHGHGRRILMARRHVDVVAAIDLFVEDQAARIDRQRRHVAGLHLKDVAGVGIARVLESDAGVAAYQEARQQIERVLCADRNQDLVRRRAYAAAREGPGAEPIGRASCRERGWQSVWLLVVAASLKK